MENDLTVKVQTKGAEEAADKIKNVSARIKDSTETTSDFSDKLSKAAVALAGIGVGLTAMSKGATDSTVDYVKSVKSLSRVIGDSVEDTSRLQYALQRSGLAADQAGQIFGIFSKKIQDANSSSADAALKQADLTNKIQAAQLKIKSLTEEQSKAGANTEELANQIDALNISIKQYQSQLDSTSNPLQKLNIATKNADGSARSFSAVLLDVADKFKAMPDGAEKTALALDLFGRSGKSMLGFLNKGSEGIKDLMEQADKLGLTIGQDNVDAVMKYVQAQKDLKDAQQAVTIAIGNEALPMWQALADAQVKIAQSFQNLPEPIRKTLAGIVAFGGPIATAASGVAGFGANLAGATGKSLPDLAKGLTGASGAAGGFLGKLLPLVAKIGLWGLAIAAVVGALWFLQDKFGILNPIIEAFSKAWESLANTWNTQILPVLQVLYQWFANNILPILQALWSVIVDQLQAAWEALSGAIANLWNALQPLLPVLEWAAAIIGGVLVAAIVVAIGAISAIAVVLSWIINIIVQVISWFINLGAGIINAFNTALKWIIDNWSNIGNWFGARVQDIKNFFSGIGQWIGARFQEGWNTITSIFGGIGNWFKARVDDVKNAGKAIIDGLVNGIVGAKDAVINKIKEICSGALDAVKSFFGIKSPSRVMMKMGAYIGQGLANGISGSQAGIMNAVGNITGAVADGFGISPTIDAGVNGTAVAGTYGAGTQTTNQFYGPIVLGDKSAVDEFFNRLGRQQEMAELGVPL